MVKEKKKCFISSVLETAAVLWELNTLLFLTYSSNPVSHRSSEQMLTQRLGAQRVFFFKLFLKEATYTFTFTGTLAIRSPFSLNC